MKGVYIIVLMAFGFSSLAQDLISLQERLLVADKLINNYQFAEALSMLIPAGAGDSTVAIDVLQRKGYCLFRMGNYGAAIREFERIIEVDSTNRNALFQLGQLYGRNTQFEEAYACYQSLISRDSTNSFYYKQLAIVASQANDPLLSIGSFMKAVKYNPRDIEAYAMLGNALLDIDQFETADSILTQALTINRSPQLRLLLAKAQLGEEKWEAVVKTTEQLMTKGDTIPVYARLLGISYFQLDQFDKVMPFMQVLLKADMKADWIYYYMGVSFQQRHEPDSAIVYLNKAIEAGISENISNYYTQLASTYEEKKDFKSSIKYYKAAYESSRADILLYHLARNYDIYYKDKSQAIAYYKRYLSSDDTIKIAKEYTRYRLDELSVYR
jgi:tetratricopeptide (TPR) repeat protein